MPTNPSQFKGGLFPVHRLTWTQAADYCNARSKAEGLQPCYDPQTYACDFEANGYRLPTEAEWEYAARCNIKTIYDLGDKPRMLFRFAWYYEVSQGIPVSVDSRFPNYWGIQSMLGNVSEWCNDFYDPDYLQNSPVQDPRGPAEGRLKSIRGGNWDTPEVETRPSYRRYGDFSLTGEVEAKSVHGFRCARRITPAEVQALKNGPE